MELGHTLNFGGLIASLSLLFLVIVVMRFMQFGMLSSLSVFLFFMVGLESEFLVRRQWTCTKPYSTYDFLSLFFRKKKVSLVLGISTRQRDKQLGENSALNH